jgi:hypothetical protein
LKKPLPKSTRQAAPLPAAPRLTLIIILLTAFALRAHHLAGASLQSDAATGLLRAWMAVAGASNYALHFVSLLAGVLAVALLQRLSSDLARPSAVRRWIGLLSAALLATNAFHVSTSQEVSPFTWLLALGLLATLALWQLLYPHARAGRYTSVGWGATYTFALAASLYLHGFGALIAVVHALYVIGWVIATRRWHVALHALGWWAGALLLSAPQLSRALDFFGGGQPAGSAATAWGNFVAWSGSAAMPAPWDAIVPWLLLALALVGLIWWVRTRPAGGLLLAALALLSFVALLLAARNPAFDERIAVVVSAPLMALAAAGTIALEPRLWSRIAARRRLQGLPVATAAVAAILLGANFAALATLYSNSGPQMLDAVSEAGRVYSAYEKEDDLLAAVEAQP